MKLKGLALTVVILAVLAGAVAWLNRAPPAPSADPRVGQSLGDAAAIAKAGRIRLSDQGKTIELDRAPDGSWRDASYYDLPADFSKLSSFTGDLMTAKIERLVTTNPDRIARLEFKDTQIAFLDAAGHPLWSVTLGKNADAGGRFVRFDGEERAYLASLNAWIDPEPKDWANAQLTDLKPDDVAKVEVSFDQGAPVVIARAKKGGPWMAAGSPARKVSDDKVSPLLASLGALRFSDTSDPADPRAIAAERHRRKIVLTTFSGRTLAVSFGRQPEVKKLKPASKPAKPEYDTIPAGPVYVFIQDSEAAAPINALMKRRAFQVDDYTFTSLPQTPADLL